jgi:hypothetical protein
MKLLPKSYKKPRRKEDLCSACFYGAELLAKKQRSSSSSSSDTVENLMDEEEEMIQGYLEHRDLVDQRRSDYKLQQEKLQPFQAQVVIDFKQDLELGKGQNTTNLEFFTGGKASVFGAVVTYVNGIGSFHPGI